MFENAVNEKLSSLSSDCSQCTPILQLQAHSDTFTHIFCTRRIQNGFKDTVVYWTFPS